MGAIVAKTIKEGLYVGTKNMFENRIKRLIDNKQLILRCLEIGIIFSRSSAKLLH